MWHVLDTSSAVTASSSPLFTPGNTHSIALSQTLNTVALYHSTFVWFGTLSCKMIPVGQLFHNSLHHLNYSMQNYISPIFCFSAHHEHLGKDYLGPIHWVEM